MITMVVVKDLDLLALVWVALRAGRFCSVASLSSGKAWGGGGAL